MNTRTIITALSLALGLAAYSLPAFAQEHAATDVGTLDKESAEKAFPTGHFLFIGVVVSLIALVCRARVPVPRWTELVPPYAIGTVAMFWLIQRIAGF